VYVPFDWNKIRGGSRPGTRGSIDREVRGQSGISREKQWEGGRIWLPGPEFVGTLSENDLPGRDFSTNPRSARIDVWYPSKEEFGLTGVTDKDLSIVHAVPRLATSYLCDTVTPEGCMGVATNLAIDSTRCACRDRYPADCQCTTESPGKFFQCSTSKMPCTRHDHCSSAERCDGQPTCQEKGTVWSASPPPGTTPCWKDSHCTDPNKPQCGYLLFNVGNKRETGKSIVKIDAKVSGARKRRGVCKNTPSGSRKVCSNAGSGAPGACTPSEGDCSGYTLEALGKP
jgi:hypothetical protein